jgi:molybdate transport system substrate-binding protein
MTEPGSQRPVLRVFSTLATQGAWPELTALVEAATGCGIETTFGPTNALMQRIANGETADAAVLTQQAADELARAGILMQGRSFARSYVGIAVKSGAAKPDISTVEAMKASLVAARAVAYSRLGASGVYFASLIQKLGIADAVNANAVVVPTGLTASRLLSGEADLAVQQLSELKAVAGIDVVGPLPMELQTPAEFTAAVFVTSGMRAAGGVMVDLLASAQARPVLIKSGLEALG